jgi:2OG-Fe(II) oxygenase superfamily
MRLLRKPATVWPNYRHAAMKQVGMRFFTSSEQVTWPIRPILDHKRFLTRLDEMAPQMAASLEEHGFWTNTLLLDNTSGESHHNDNEENIQELLTLDEIIVMRQQAIALRENGRFEPSWSERIDVFGVPKRFDKPGVFACEPDGRDFDRAPDLVMYMSTVIQHLPPLLNASFAAQQQEQSSSSSSSRYCISNQAFNAKLAVTSPGGSVYPLHVDNPTGGLLDLRKLTCILYLNPIYAGGALRLLLLGGGCLDLSPCAGRMVLFWSDEIPHEVLPCAPHFNNNDDTGTKTTTLDRYALTIWLPDDDPANVHPDQSKFQSLRVGAFMNGNWC